MFSVIAAERPAVKSALLARCARLATWGRAGLAGRGLEEWGEEVAVAGYSV
jgi:hypothetical protein